MVGKTAREYPKTEELREAAKAAFGWQGTRYEAFTIFFNQQEDHRNILIVVLKEYPLIFIESVKNGIQLTMNESLYD